MNLNRLGNQLLKTAKLGGGWATVAGEPWGSFIRGWAKAVEGLRMRAERGPSHERLPQTFLYVIKEKLPYSIILLRVVSCNTEHRAMG